MPGMYNIWYDLVYQNNGIAPGGYRAGVGTSVALCRPRFSARSAINGSYSRLRRISLRKMCLRFCEE